ncbi:MAG: hypothetical protein WC341_03945 [Bacteroidales bacterium]|jgi:deoxyribodipyrimidine photolyase-like uncharacterized protein
MEKVTAYNFVRLVFGNQLKEQHPTLFNLFGMDVLLIDSQGFVKIFNYDNQKTDFLAKDGFKNEMILNEGMGIITGMLHS